MYYTQLRAFHAVAIYGGFSKAAMQLRLAQPSISAHVRTLENDFGVLLFNRRKRSVQPTELGEQLLRITRRLIETEQEAIELLTETQVLERGFLALAADGPTHAIPLIAHYRKQYPGVKVILKTGNTREVHDWLIDFEADILVAAQMPKDDRLVQVTLRRDPMVAYVSASHPWSRRKTVSLEEFADTSVVIREKGSTTRHLLEDELTRRNIQPADYFEVDGQEAARAAVAAGLGVGIISKPELGNDPGLVSLRLNDCKIEMEEVIACLKERQHLKIIQSFIDLAKDQTCADRLKSKN